MPNYRWVEVDAEGTPVADGDRTEGLLATDAARPVFTAPALAAERVLRYRFTVQGRGHGGTDAHTASDTVTVTVRAAPAVTAVALTSVPQNPTFRTYRRGDRIEVSVTFSAPVTVTGKPTIGLEVGTETRQAAYITRSAPHVLVFGYMVAADDTDDDGVAVPANGILLAGGTIVDELGGAVALGHDAVAADTAHKVDGSGLPALTGGVCGAHAAGARRSGGGGAGDRPDGGLLGCRRRHPARKNHRPAAAVGPGHRGAEAHGLRRPDRGDDPHAEWQRAERAAGGGVFSR